MRWAAKRSLRVALIAGLLLTACSGHRATPTQQLRGTRVAVLAGWSGTERARFLDVLHAFASQTGARVTYLSSAGRYLPDRLDELTARNQAPDIAMLSQPGLLRRYAAEGRIVALDPATVREVAGHYAAAWRALARVGGREYGVWFKAANKSLVWYDVAGFERSGCVPPESLSGLERVAAALRAGGLRPFSVGAGDGWVLTDWFENLYLRLAGASRYDALAAHRLPWTDPTVAEALRWMRRLLVGPNLLGGVHGALRTSFEQSVPRAFTSPAGAAMVMEGDFVGGFLPPSAAHRIGTTVDVFPFPSDRPGAPQVVGGGDVAVDFTHSPAARALMRFLASPAAAVVWARRGGFVSPNQDVDLAVYPDPVSKAAARQLIEAGDGFRFDLSDLAPAAFGARPDAGMQGALRHFLSDGDIARTQGSLETSAEAAGS